MNNLLKFLNGFFIVTVLLGCASNRSWAAATVINPSDDGSIYSSGYVVTNQYLMSDSGVHGIVVFSTDSIATSNSQATLSVNPYGLPLWGNPVAVYGFQSNVGYITSSEYNAGVFLGNWYLPSNLGYGQDAFFDVTAFLQNANSPFVGFNLQSGGTDVFSSLEYNYGHPSQLTVTAVPLPSTAFLFAPSLVGLLGLAKFQTTPCRKQSKLKTLKA